MRYRRLLTRVAIGCSLLSLASTALQADDFVLTTGASVRGQWLNRDEASARFYLVATEHGGCVTLPHSRVVDVILQSEAHAKYDRLAPTVADTVADQWKLAKWCQGNDLEEQCNQHLLRVLELDPEHELARRALGYAEIGGQWVKKEVHLQGKGYVRYKGHWRLRQEVELAERRQAEELARKDWYVKLSRWRSQLNKEKRHTALDNIRQVHDPLAIEAIGRMLQVERDRRLRLIYVEVLGQIADTRATGALVELALTDRDEEVYYASVVQLGRRKTPPVVRQFVLALDSQQNDRVNRAAIALGAFGDASVIPPLVDALVTRHDFVLPGNDMISSTFLNRESSGLGDSFTSGPTAPQVVTQTATNQEVLKTLVKLAGVSFGFDQRAWRNWYTVQQRHGQPTFVDARRLD